MNRATVPPLEVPAARPAVETQDAIARFSAGDNSRAEAMRSLQIGYGELLDRLAHRGLPLPRVTDAEAEAMADALVALTMPTVR